MSSFFSSYGACDFLGLRTKGLQYWLPYDFLRELQLRSGRKNQNSPTHVIFAFVDHFEPGNGGVALARQKARVTKWAEEYPLLARRHQDSDGRHPSHTFFFPPHYDTDDHLARIVQLCGQGFGEVEMHLHHDRHGPWPDDESSLRQKIMACVNDFSRHGAFSLPDGTKKFAFIHGDWALANSRHGGAHCGVNDEISILRDAGCFSDFTFPISNESQPRLCNRFFYGASTPEYPKGYNRLYQEVVAGNKNRPGILFVQGPIGLRWQARTHHFKPSIEQSNIDKMDAPFPCRIDYWVNKGIHVFGRPEWVFIKIHTHGAREVDWDVLLGRACDEMFGYLEERYNDGVNYMLHYVSAREMYNIIRAAEDEQSGNPTAFRDYEIPRYVYLPPKVTGG